MNRFVVLDLRDVEVPGKPELIALAMALCANSFADDMLLITPSAVADARLDIIGGDGLDADFCGNGLLYVAAKLGREQACDRVKIETPAGVRTAVRTADEWEAEVGEAVRLDGLDQSRLADRPVLGLIRAGEPHLVLGIPPELPGFHVARAVFEDYCRPLRDAIDIPGGINVTMVFQHTDDSVLIRTFERGVRRHTYSCGTGAVSAVAAVFGTPGQDRTFHVCSPGGMHDIRFAGGRWHVAARPERLARGAFDGQTIHLPLAGLSTDGAGAA
jgi:diaminopimelate epimerase